MANTEENLEKTIKEILGELDKPKFSPTMGYDRYSSAIEEMGKTNSQAIKDYIKEVQEDLDRPTTLESWCDVAIDKWGF